MLSAQEWWGIMALYGAGIWPAQAAFYLVALTVTGLVFVRPGGVADSLVRIYLALAFGWISVMFFFLIGRDLFGNQVFGTLFGVVALLFATDLIREKMTFVPPQAGWQRHLSLVLIGLVFAYPLIGLALGHAFPRTVVPGTFPCPTAALALLMLSFALPRADKIALALLLFWAVPLPIFVQIPKYGVYEDAVMLAVGLYTIAILMFEWTHNRPNSGKNHPIATA